jgi:hypothetical protein
MKNKQKKGFLFFLFFCYNYKQTTMVFIFLKPNEFLEATSLAQEESTQILKSETQLRTVKQKERQLMIPDAVGALSRADQLRNVEESLGIKKENRHLTS